MNKKSKLFFLGFPDNLQFRIRKVFYGNKNFKLEFKNATNRSISELSRSNADIIIVDFNGASSYSNELHAQTQKLSVPVLLLLSSVSEKAMNFYSIIRAKDFLLKKNIKALPEKVSELISQQEITQNKNKPDKDILNKELLIAITDQFPRSYVGVIDQEMKIIYNGGEEFSKQNINPRDYINQTVEQVFDRYGNGITQLVLNRYKKTFKGEAQFFELKLDERILVFKTIPLRLSGKKISHILVVTENITDSQVSELKSRELAEQYAETLERVTDGFVSLDRNWNYIVVNKAACRMLGKTEEELIGKNIWDIFPERVDGQFYDKCHEAFQNQKYVYLEDYYEPSGHWFEYYIYPSKNGLSVYFRNITTQKESETIIRQLEKKTEAAVRIGQIGFWEWDLVNDEMFWSDRMYEIYGLKKGDKLTYSSVIACLHPDDRAFHDLVVKDRMETGDNSPFEYRIIRPDGEIRFVHVHIEFVSDSNGKAIQFRGTVIDITEIKLAEQKLKELTDKLEDAEHLAKIGSWVIDVIDSSGNFWSKENFRMFGFESADQPPPLDEFLKRIHPDDRLNVRSAFEQMSAGDMPHLVVFRSNPEMLPLRYYKPTVRREVEPGNKMHKFIGTVQDITEQMLAERKLKESEEKYRTLVEQASETIFIMNQQGRFITINRSGEQLTGYKLDELMQMSIYDFADKDELRERPLRFKELFKGVNTTTERKMHKKDGSKIDVEVNAKLLDDGNILVFIRDISERKKAEEEILNAKKQFQSLVENISGVYWVNDISSRRTLYISPSYETIWGRSCEELYSDPADFIESIHPEDKAAVVQAHENLSKDRNSQIEYRIIRPDGSIRWIKARTKVVVESNGKLTEYGYAEDITGQKLSAIERQQLTQRNQQIITSMLDGFILADGNGNILDVNPSYCMMTGYSREELLQMNINELESNLSQEAILERINEMLEKRSIQFETVHRMKNGKHINLEVSITIMDNGGSPLVAAFVRDITERISSKKSIEEYAEQLSLLNTHLQNVREEERTNISRELHDELGQQLTAIKMDMSRLENLKSQGKAEQFNAAETIRLIDEAILTTRRIHSELRPNLLDDLGLFAALEYQMEKFAKRTNLECKLKIDMTEPDLDRRIAIGVFRVFQESLTNIARHANAETVLAEIQKVNDHMELLI
ncbi:MAG: PAS domain S-box protein [Bacteroidetes bacterium]|nr:MAG: PAS domain S-box protein [Bacteroidota bacterium]REK05704.1 MAG: PAS domain S-box protein [Bacteroidota bacterium]REK31990.1 MAG: PAS domain S-box protein [Bacteroidota bacterium]REK50054.1 MAG: PAS domain S-box protein [Bacteroidota bacterium]